MKWLTTPFAILIHATFVLLTLLLACELLAGNHGPGGDYGLGLLFCLVAYPVILLLLRLNWRMNGGALPCETDPRHHPGTHSQIGADTTIPGASEAESSVVRMVGPPGRNRSDLRRTTVGCQEQRAQRRSYTRG